jgi:hypothetical protein
MFALLFAGAVQSSGHAAVSLIAAEPLCEAGEALLFGAVALPIAVPGYVRPAIGGVRAGPLLPARRSAL